jgi:hypothetical protein
MAEKMILIPQDAVQRMHGDQTNMKSLDKEMSIILQSKMSDADKWKKYNQVLQRYLHISGERRKPVELSMSHSKTDLLKESLMSTVPAQYKRKAMGFYDFLLSSNLVSWDESGVVSIKGTLIPDSHIVELINDVLRYRKSVEPVGWMPFAKALADLNVSKEIVGNKVRFAYMHNTEQEGSGLKWCTYRFTR